MKVHQIKVSEGFKPKGIIRSRKRMNEDTPMKSFHFEFTVDGTKSAQDVKAISIEDAKKLVQKQYSGKNVMFTVAREAQKPQQQNQQGNANEALDEDTVKQNGKWVNKGKEGTHGTFKTKKQADAQRKAMFAKGYTESLDDIDDDFSFEEIYGDFADTSSDKTEEAPEGNDAGIASIIHGLIIDEWEAIEGYNPAIEACKNLGFTDIAEVLTHIQNEENKHVGELQQCLATISDSAKKIEVGTVEASKELAVASDEVPQQLVKQAPNELPQEGNPIEDKVKEFFIADDDVDGLGGF